MKISYTVVSFDMQMSNTEVHRTLVELIQLVIAGNVSSVQSRMYALAMAQNIICFLL